MRRFERAMPILAAAITFSCAKEPHTRSPFLAMHRPHESHSSITRRVAINAPLA